MDQTKFGSFIAECRKENKLTQEQYANKTKFKMAYISTIETGSANLTCKNIDFIAKTLNIKPKQLFEEETAKLANSLPSRVDTYYKGKTTNL